MLGMVYWQGSHAGVIPYHADTAIKVATSAGTVFGQLVFGYLADLLGRKRMYGIELLIIICGTLAQSLCAPSPAIGFVGIMVFWRTVMGIGVGGDYPMSAVITSEMSDTRWRGGIIAAVFSMQGLGQFSAAMVALIVTFSYKDTLVKATSPGDCDAQCIKSVDVMWRILLGFGAIPGWFALYYRLSIPETPRYTFDVKQDLEKATADARRFRLGLLGEGQTDNMARAQTKVDMRKYHRPPPTLGEFFRYFKKWKHLKTLIGTAGSWFFLDVAFYGLGLNTPTILSSIGFSSKGNVFEILKNLAVGQLVLTLAGAIPGYWLAIGFIDWLGRKSIQIGGFLILTILFVIIGFGYNYLSQTALLVLYVLCQLFFNFGKLASNRLK
jgi:PHS family inorganic phosphate transporter-like MFS transporter